MMSRYVREKQAAGRHDAIPAQQRQEWEVDFKQFIARLFADRCDVCGHIYVADEDRVLQLIGKYGQFIRQSRSVCLACSGG